MGMRPRSRSSGGNEGSIGLKPHFLLDTHVLVRWLVEPKRLSQEQSRELRGAVQRGEPLAISAITLLEIATLFDKASKRQRAPAQEILAAVDADAGLQVVPIDVEFATEVAALGDLLGVQA